MVFMLQIIYNEKQIYPVDTTEGIGWKNIHGFPCNSIVNMASTDEGYIIPIPGLYSVGFSGNDVLVNSSMILDIVPGADFPYNIIPGIECYFNEMITDWLTFAVIVGGYWDDGNWVNVLDFGNNPIGQASENKTIKIKNNSGSDLHNLRISLCNRAIIDPTSWVVSSVSQVPGYFPQVIYSSDITFAEKDSTTIQLLVGGNGVSLVDDSGNVYLEGRGLLYDGSTPYTFLGNYEGIKIVISPHVTNDTTSTINVYENEWEFQYAGNWNTDETIGTLAAGSEIEVDLRLNPYLSVSEGVTHALLQIQSDEESLSVPLAAYLFGVDGTSDTSAYGQLFLRASVISESYKNALEEFGVTLAS
jgi:hypothetical protein